MVTGIITIAKGQRMAVKIVETDIAFKKFFKNLKAFNGIEAAVGVPEEFANEIVSDEGDFTRVEQAVVHEFGSADGHIEERSFLRSTFNKNREKYQKDLEKAAAKVARLDSTPLRELTVFSEKVRNDVVNRIRDGEITPELAESTIDAKGSSLPLVDTGGLVGSIQARVLKK